MASFRLKKVPIVAGIVFLSVPAIYHMYKKSKKNNPIVTEEPLRFSHQYPEDAMNSIPSQEVSVVSDNLFINEDTGLQIVAEENFVDSTPDLPKIRKRD